MKKMLLGVIKRAKGKYRFNITNFCIMSNHIHIIITPGRGESLSKIMQWILSVFAILYNKYYGWIGHVWYDRFKSKILHGLGDFLRAFRYIAENPVRAGMVRYPWSYEFNGVTYLRNRDFQIIDEPPAFLNLMESSLCLPVLLA